jgi:hypothetical protein
MPNVEVVGHGTYWFPDNMSDDDIRRAVREDDIRQQQAKADYGTLGNLALGAAGGAGEAISSGISGLARMVGARDFADYISELSEKDKTNLLGTGLTVPTSGTAAQIGNIAGSALGYLGAGAAASAAAPVLGIGTALASGLAAGALGVGGGYEDARKRVEQARLEGRDVSEAEEWMANTGGGALGALQAIPAERLLGSAVRPLAKVLGATGEAGLGAAEKLLESPGIRGYAADAGIQALLQGGQGATAAAGQNVLEQMYRPERGTWEGVGEAGGVGAGVGAALSLLTRGAGRYAANRRYGSALEEAKVKAAADAAATGEVPPGTAEAPEGAFGGAVEPTPENPLGLPVDAFRQQETPEPRRAPVVPEVPLAAGPEPVPQPPIPEEVPAPAPQLVPEPPAPVEDTSGREALDRIGTGLAERVSSLGLGRKVNTETLDSLIGQPEEGQAPAPIHAAARVGLDVFNPEAPPTQEHLRVWRGLDGGAMDWLRESNILNPKEWGRLLRVAKERGHLATVEEANPDWTPEQQQAQAVADVFRTRAVGQGLSGSTEPLYQRGMTMLGELGNRLRSEGVRTPEEITALRPAAERPRPGMPEPAEAPPPAPEPVPTIPTETPAAPPAPAPEPVPMAASVVDPLRVRIQDQLRSHYQQMNLDRHAAIEVADQVLTGTGQPAEGVHLPNENLVRISWTASDPALTPEQRFTQMAGVADHEAVHIARPFFKENGWRLLVREATKRGHVADAEALYKDQPGYTPERVQAEAVANLFRDRAQGLRLAPAAQRLYDRMMQFFERTGNTFRGLGFQTADDVMRSLATGEVGLRGEPSVPLATPVEAQAPVRVPETVPVPPAAPIAPVAAEPPAPSAAPPTVPIAAPVAAEAPPSYSLPRPPTEEPPVDPTKTGSLSDRIVAAARLRRSGQDVHPSVFANPADHAFAEKLAADKRIDLDRLAKINPDEYMNFSKVDASDQTKEHLRNYVRLAVAAGGYGPKDKIPFAEIERQTRELLRGGELDVKKLKEGETLHPANRLATNIVVRDNVEQIQRKQSELAKNASTMSNEERLRAQYEIDGIEKETQKLLNVLHPARSQDGRNLVYHRIMASGSFDTVYWSAKLKRILNLPEDVNLPEGMLQPLIKTLGEGKEAQGTLEEAKKTGEPAKVKAAEKKVLDSQAEVAAYVSKHQKSTLTQFILGLWKAGLLTGPQTAIANDLSNGGFAVLERLSSVPASWVDTALGVGTNRRTVTHDLRPEAISASWKGLKEGTVESGRLMRDAFTGNVRPEQDVLGKTQLHQLLNYGDGSNMGLRLANDAGNGVFAFHSALDKPFSQMALANELSKVTRLAAVNEGNAGTLPKGMTVEQRIEQLRQNTPNDLKIEAQARASVLTFANENGAAQALEAYKRKLRSRGTAASDAGATAIDVIIPFSKVPSNVFQRLLEYSPLGLAAGTGRLALAAKKIANGTLDAKSQRIYSELIGRGLIGSGMMFLGYKAAQAGLMTGFRDKTDTAGRAADEAVGRPQMAMKVGNNWVQFNRISPMGNLLAVGAALYRENERPLSVVANRPGNIAAAVTHSVMDMPMLSGMSNLIDAIQSPDRFLSGYAQRQLGSIVPTAVANVATVLDPTMRDMKDQSLAAGLQKRIPFWRSGLPPLQDQRGHIVPEPGATPLGPMFDVFRTTTERQDPVSQEMIRNDFTFGDLKQNTKEGESRDLYRLRAGLAGALNEQYLSKMIGTAKYQRADIGEARRDLLKDAREDAGRRLSELTTRNRRYSSTKTEEPEKMQILERYLQSLR